MYLLPDTILVERFLLSAQCVSLIKASKVCINLARVGGCDSLWKWEHVRATASEPAPVRSGPCVQSMFPARSGCGGRALTVSTARAAPSAGGSCALYEALQTSHGVPAGPLQRLLPCPAPGQSSDPPRLQPGWAAPTVLDGRRDLPGPERHRGGAGRGCPRRAPLAPPSEPRRGPGRRRPRGGGGSRQVGPPRSVPSRAVPPRGPARRLRGPGPGLAGPAPCRKLQLPAGTARQGAGAEAARAAERGARRLAVATGGGARAVTAGRSGGKWRRDGPGARPERGDNPGAEEAAPEEAAPGALTPATPREGPAAGGAEASRRLSAFRRRRFGGPNPRQEPHRPGPRPALAATADAEVGAG